MKLLKKLIFTVSLINTVNVFAGNYTKQNINVSKASQSVAKGGVATGGGDLCENRIKTIRDDLKTWITSGGSESLDLPTGMEQNQYVESMLGAISAAKIRCVTKGDSGFPVQVNGIPKACRFDRSSREALITCDANKFMFLNDSQQYVLVHHEYAGIANIEVPNGSDSDYTVSNQISDFLIETSVKKLAVRFSGTKFKSVPENELDDLKRQIQKYSRAYETYQNKSESESWYALQYVENVAYKQSPEDRVKNATSAKMRVDGNKTVLLFETMVDRKLKTAVALSIENNIIQSVRVEMLALEIGELQDDGTIPYRWKVIGWESYN